MAWVYLIVAGLLEIGFATTLKLTEGFTKTGPTIVFLMFSVLSFWCLTRALTAIPIGMAYSIWTGIGAAGTVVVGALLFSEHLSAWQFFFLATLVGSIVGLKFIG